MRRMTRYGIIALSATPASPAELLDTFPTRHAAERVLQRVVPDAEERQHYSVVRLGRTAADFLRKGPS